jgi:hypothetical protein
VVAKTAVPGVSTRRQLRKHDTGSATVHGMAAALMLAASRPLANTGRHEFGRGALACVERAFRAQSGAAIAIFEMSVGRAEQELEAALERLAFLPVSPASRGPACVGDRKRARGWAHVSA